jgi:hypothetical protein
MLLQLVITASSMSTDMLSAAATATQFHQQRMTVQRCTICYSSGTAQHVLTCIYCSSELTLYFAGVVLVLLLRISFCVCMFNNTSIRLWGSCFTSSTVILISVSVYTTYR